jgi:membrane-bound lytic murein transglycosylase A
LVKFARRLARWHRSMMRGAVLVVVALGCTGREPARPLPITADAAAPVAATPDAGAPPDAAVAPVLATVPCTIEEPADGATAEHDELTLTRVTFAELPGWANDKHGEAVGSFLRSCERLARLKDADPVGHDGHGGTAGQWRAACAAAQQVPAGDHAAARAMFETQFVPWIAAGKKGPEGKLTGYYVQELRASRKQGGAYQTPVYGRPKDLVMVDLSKFINDSHGKRIWGRFDDKGELQPFYTRQEIRKGALAGRGLEILYVDEPIDLLFAHIEGSAKAKLDDGSTIWLDFGGKNGRSYRGVGAILKGMGELQAPGSGTMQGIHKWLREHRDKWDYVVDQVASFVFFEESKNAGALGSQMVVLTAQRSMAIDRAFIAQSTPIWVESKSPVAGTGVAGPWRKLLIAQDTGGGILGAVRGDIYWGDDATAAEIGGRMGGPGRYWLLLPKGVTK